jgi:hypothetical protein
VLCDDTYYEDLLSEIRGFVTNMMGDIVFPQSAESSG